MVKRIEIGETDQHRKQYDESLVETTHVSNPIKHGVHIPVDPIQIQIELVSHLKMHVIRKLIRSILDVMQGEDSAFVFSQGAELQVFIL